VTARLLGSGYRGAERVAGAVGIDRAVSSAAEEAIVRAIESPTVERALARLLRGPAVEEAVADALTSPALEAAIVEVLESEMVDRVWDRLLDSDEVQRLIERIAEAPEVRSAIAAQGVGLLDDLRRQLRNVVRRLDDAIERVTMRLLRRPLRTEPTEAAGALTRIAAFVLDAALINVSLLALSAALAFLVHDIFGAGNAEAPVIVVGAGLWLAIGAAYLMLFWSVAGQTPGMRFFGIRVTDVEGATPISARRAARRLIGLVLAILPLGLGFLGVLTSERRRGFHDRFAATEVVYPSQR
jgi:uncharacterized RDD family membrane protein YckC